MGAFLSNPVTDIEFGIEKTKDVTAAFSSMQGWRASQEVRDFDFIFLMFVFNCFVFRMLI